MKNVYVVLDGFAVGAMFENNGFTVVQDITEADIVCFTGGEDVHPSYYGEENVASYTNINRDKFEIGILEKCKELDIPMVGICRGGQFLNVMAGGKMWQDVDNHGIGGTHGVLLRDEETGEEEIIQCSSTHHQMMRAGPDSEVIGVATPARSTYKTNADGTIHHHLGVDTEIVVHPKINALSFQPHPEFFQPDHECQQLFFRLIKKYLA
ncbi:MAG: gamma-glutamyl-gamma-aminobutyrate hydrolase family protein [Aeromonadaceae bacterium]